jgi:hypothetical protein
MTEIFQYFETTRIARYNPAIAFHSLKKYRDEIRYSAILNYAYGWICDGVGLRTDVAISGEKNSDLLTLSNQVATHVYVSLVRMNNSVDAVALLKKYL